MLPPPLFLPARLVRNAAWFVAGIAFCYGIACVMRNAGIFSGSRYFPVNVFAPRGMSAGLVLAGGAVWAVGVSVIAGCRRRGYPLWAVCAAGLLLLLGTNLLQGVGPNRNLSRGFAFPVSGTTRAGGIQYYHDAPHVVTPVDFVRNFAFIQPMLHDHGRTHPPGAVLLFYVLTRLTGNRPALMGLVLAAFSAVGSAWAMAHLARTVLPEAASGGDTGDTSENAGYATLLLLLLPAVQIYFCATLDGVVCALLLAGVTFACKKQTLLSALCFFAASFLTFGAVWVVPVLMVLARQNKDWKRFAATLGLVVTGYFALYAVWGFRYLAAAQTASHLENPHGFRLLHDPVGYAMTRWEDVAEIALFAGPFVLAAVWRGMTWAGIRKNVPTAFWLAAAGGGTLAGLFLTGAYRTGETARACVFIYPFLLLPVAAFFCNKNGKMSGEPNGAKNTLLVLVWTQSVLMQVIGDYFW